MVSTVVDSEGLTSGSTPGSASGQALWLFILISSLAGFAAILTPCVFPMIPMTVSFFMRGSENRGKAIRNGLFFGLSILLIFAFLGALFTFGLFGPNVGNILKYPLDSKPVVFYPVFCFCDLLSLVHSKWCCRVAW
jgi:thiol:disulfide interchange protein